MYLEFTFQGIELRFKQILLFLQFVITQFACLHVFLYGKQFVPTFLYIQFPIMNLLKVTLDLINLLYHRLMSRNSLKVLL